MIILNRLNRSTSVPVDTETYKVTNTKGLAWLVVT